MEIILDRLATKDNLIKRGIVLLGGDISCCLCGQGVEQSYHIFSKCKGAWFVWMKELGWWGLQGVLPNDIFGLVEFVVHGISGGCLVDYGPSFFFIVAWFIWFWRNMKVFKIGLMYEVLLLEYIQHKLFLWLKNREIGCVFSYQDWVIRPIDCRDVIVQHCKNLKIYRKLQRDMG